MKIKYYLLILLFSVQMQQKVAASNPQSKEAIFWNVPAAISGQRVLVKGYFDTLKNHSVILSCVSYNDQSGWSYTHTVQLSCESMGESALSFQIPSGYPESQYVYHIDNDESLRGNINLPVINWAEGYFHANHLLSIMIKGTRLPRRGYLFIKNDTFITSIPFVRMAKDNLVVVLKQPLDSARFSIALSVGNGAEFLSNFHSLIPSFSFDQGPQIMMTHLNGNGRSDNTEILLKYLQDYADAGHVTLTFPKGKFLFHRQLQIPPGIYLQGAGSDKTFLVGILSEEKPPRSWISGTHDFGILNLSLSAPVINCLISNRYQKGGPPGNVLLSDLKVQLDAYRPDSMPRPLPTSVIELEGSHLLIDHCFIDNVLRISPLDYPHYTDNVGIFLTGCQNVKIINNVFHLGDWGVGLFVKSGRNVLIDSNFIHGQGSHPGASSGISLWGTSRYGPSRNIIVQNNVIENMTGNFKEAITTDGGAGYYLGKASFHINQPMELLLSYSPFLSDEGIYFTGMDPLTLSIVDGKGAGQFRAVKSLFGNKLLIDVPWKISPDSSSLFSLNIVEENVRILDNHIVNTGALQFYGNVFGGEISGNELINTDGISLYSGYYFGGMAILQNIFIHDNKLNGSSSLSKNGVLINARKDGFISGLAIRHREPVDSSHIIQFTHQMERVRGCLIETSEGQRFNYPYHKANPSIKIRLIKPEDDH